MCAQYVEARVIGMTNVGISQVTQSGSLNMFKHPLTPNSRIKYQVNTRWNTSNRVEAPKTVTTTQVSIDSLFTPQQLS